MNQEFEIDNWSDTRRARITILVRFLIYLAGLTTMMILADRAHSDPLGLNRGLDSEYQQLFYGSNIVCEKTHVSVTTAFSGGIRCLQTHASFTSIYNTSLTQ